MNGETTPLTGSNMDNSFYTGQEGSIGEYGTSGKLRRVLHGLPIIFVLIACGFTIYGSVQAGSAAIILPFIVVFSWLIIHFLLLLFSRNENHNFHPPAWFIFVSIGQIFIHSLTVVILTLIKKEN
jgi:hypothetical protein